MLKIKDLKVSIEDKEILKGINLDVLKGKVHVLMGPNGSGKSTLAQTIMGNPMYTVTSGDIVLENESILDLEPHARALKGIFLSFQYPSEVTGVTISNFLRMIYNKRHVQNLSPVKFRKILEDKMNALGMNTDFAQRYLNDGFSGGEKKRMEMLQMSILEPKIAILDETDSGLDIDALKIVSNAVNTLKKDTNMSVLIITHYTRILQHIQADKVHILQDGVIVREGNRELADELEQKGYAPFGE